MHRTLRRRRLHLGYEFFRYQNIVFDKTKGIKRIGFVPARCSEKDPYCPGGNCYSNILEEVELISVMVFLSVVIIIVVLRILRLQRLLPPCCDVCCECVESNACCKICCKRKSAYTELGEESDSSTVGVAMVEKQAYEDTARRDEEGNGELVGEKGNASEPTSPSVFRE